MKKILIAMLIVGGFVTANYYEHHYTREDCVVIDVNDEWVQVQDKCGFYWVFENDGFEKGDICDMKMFDNCTVSNIDDDEIIKVIKH